MKPRVHCTLVVAMAVMIACFSTSAAEQIDAATLKALTTTVEVFAEDVATGDLEAAALLFDSRERARSRNFPALLAQMHVYISELGGPEQYRGFAAINEVNHRGAAAGEVKLLVYNLLLPEKFAQILEGTPYPLDSDSPQEQENNLAEFVAALNPDRLSGFTLVELIPLTVSPRPGRDLAFERRKAYDHIQGYAECLAIYEWSGQRFAGGVTMVRYDDAHWRIRSLSSSNRTNYFPHGRLIKVDKDVKIDSLTTLKEK